MESAAESTTPEPKKTAGAGAAAWLRDNAAVLLLTGLFGYALWTVQDATANIRTDVRRMEDRIERRFDQVLSELHGINGRLRAVETHAAVANQRFDNIDQRLDGIDRRLDNVDERFDGIDQRLDNVDERLDGIDQRLDNVDQRLDGIDRRLDNVDERFDGIDQRLDNVDERLDGIDQRLDNVDERLDGIDERLDGIDQRLGGIDQRLGGIEDGIAARRPEAPEPAGGRTPRSAGTVGAKRTWRQERGAVRAPEESASSYSVATIRDRSIVCTNRARRSSAGSTRSPNSARSRAAISISGVSPSHALQMKAPTSSSRMR